MVLLILMGAARRRPDVPLWKMLLLGRGLYPGADEAAKEDRATDDR
jgi:3'-phosphoadenosine 5'-phosphosulfate sulfotransferase